MTPTQTLRNQQLLPTNRHVAGCFLLVSTTAFIVIPILRVRKLSLSAITQQLTFPRTCLFFKL